MMNKKQARLRRARQTRIKIASQDNVHRILVHRSNQHIYVQVYSMCGQKVLLSASTLDVEVKKALAGKSGGNKDAAKIVGAEIAKRIVVAGIDKAHFAFDRSGLPFHGRVKELVDEMCANGVSLKR
jgi:large subunit ribosomal protein L18